MIRYRLVPLFAVSLLSSVSAETLIWADNFNTGLGQMGLDSSPLDGRRSGAEATTIMARSSQVQQLTVANQLYMFGSGGRVRFQTDANTWCNWAAIPSSAAILSAGGLSVEFDMPTIFNTNAAAWMGFSIGFKGSSAGEPTVRVTDAETDFGFMMGKDGTYTRYGNGVAIGSPLTGSSAGSRHVKLDYLFSSFADGSPVTVKTTVAGEMISYDTFTWKANSGELYMELENRGGDTYFDNLKFATITIYAISLTKDGYDFRSGSPAGTKVGDFSAATLQNSSGVEASTYTFVAGDGDTDNSKFAINASGQLVTGAYDFKLGAAKKAYSIRVKGTGNQTGTTTQQVFTITPVKDDDMDQLPDDWELSFPGNTSLANLTGLLSGPGPGAGTGDYDGDGITDLSEYNISLATPGYSPISLDSDGDGISDEEEENPTASDHVVTSAVLADTDGDGIKDNVEYTLGTSPVLADSDFDGARDGFEKAHGSDPLNYDSRPALPAGFTLVQVTDDASSGISADKTYTHHVSGGAVATVNGVVFEALTPTSAPANFTWTASAGRAAATAPNPGGWVAANGGVTGLGLQELLGTFAYASVNTNVTQTYALSGLTPGQAYQVKLFIRKFSDGSGRSIDLTYTNGSDVQMPFDALMYDRPGDVLKNDNSDSAYYVSYSYVAQGTTLTITAATPLQAPADNGSAHFYGLTNEVVGPVVTDLKITGVTRSSTGSLTLTFKGAASTTYKVTKSADLTTFVPLTIPLSLTTDATGAAQAVIPASEASEAKEFYRIEK